MKDLGYLEDAVILVGNIYSHSNTIFIEEHFGKTQKYQYSVVQYKKILYCIFTNTTKQTRQILQMGRNGPRDIKMCNHRMPKNNLE